MRVSIYNYNVSMSIASLCQYLPPVYIYSVSISVSTVYQYLLLHLPIGSVTNIAPAPISSPRQTQDSSLTALKAPVPESLCDYPTKLRSFSDSFSALRLFFSSTYYILTVRGFYITTFEKNMCTSK